MSAPTLRWPQPFWGVVDAALTAVERLAYRHPGGVQPVEPCGLRLVGLADSLGLVGEPCDEFDGGPVCEPGRLL